MNDSKTLLLVKNLSNLNNKERYVSLLPLDLSLESKLKITEVKFNLPNSEKLYQRYDFCENLFNEILSEIKQSLNIIHKVNFTVKEWNIIIGKWLQSYIYYSFKTYEQIKFVKKNYNIKKVYITNSKNFDFITDDTYKFIDISISDLNWHLNFCSKIAEYLKLEQIEIKENYSTKKNKKEIKVNIKIKTIIKNFLNNIFIRLRSQNDAFIAKTYLPFFEEKKLELSINYLPSFYENLVINYKPINKEIRKKLVLNTSSKISVKNFIKKNMHLFMPKAYLENFNELIVLAKSRYFPQNPKFIFTSELYAYDEVFKVYAANQIKKKSLFIGQHGNNYFTQIHCNYSNETIYAHKFLSWGHEKKKETKNLIGLFNFKTLNIDTKKEKNKKEKIIIVLNSPRNILYNLFYSPDETKKSLNSLIFFLKKLKKSIRKNIILRLEVSFYKKIYGIKYFNLLKNCGFTIDDGKKKYLDLIKDAKLCIFFYDSSGFFENYCYDVPSLIFENKNYLNCINDEFQEKYKLMLNKFFFNNEILLADHVNNIWPDVDKWWSHDASRKVLNKFNDNLNVCSKKNSLKTLKSKLLDNI